MSRGMIIERVGPQRHLWPWNSVRESETGGEKGSLCLCRVFVFVLRLRGHRVCLRLNFQQLESASQLSSCRTKLPILMLQPPAIAQHPLSWETHIVFKRKRKPSQNTEEKQARSRKRGSERDCPNTFSDFYFLCWFDLVVRMATLL